MANVIGIILVVILVVILWFSGGGLVQLIAPPNGGQQTTQTENDIPLVETPSETKNIRIYSASSRSDEPENEYIEIQADYSNTVPINISGWKLQNRDGDIFILPTGAGLPYSGRVNIEEAIKLNPGERAIIITGRSPIEVSFRPNACTGYFNRLYEFNPRLPENCPEPNEEKGVDDQNDACFSYLKTVSRCKTPVASDMPSDVDFACREFIDQRLSYAGCVENHKKDANFFSGEWRIYLKQDKAIWSNVRENIKLFDQNSDLVAETSI
ncbi:MAG: hypothetical protein HYY55_02850 [Candidatus Niyogibacteria bacterium]|nr:MAG: hypothetical protein HYY55_02850 [Candidatus Niyogibacteria bacterium]